MKRNKTYSAKQKDIKKEWKLIDLKGKVLGRASVEIATMLRGKTKPSFTPHMDCGDYVVVINASQVKITGKKADQKIYFRHSDYPGGAKYFTFSEMMDKDPRKVIKEAVFGMLPKGRLGRAIVKNMKVYNDDKHPYGEKIKN